VAQNDLGVRDAHDLRGLDKILVAEGQYVGPYDSHVPPPLHHGQGNHDFVQAAAKGHYNGHGQHKGRYGPHDIGHPHQYFVNDSTVIARNRTESDPNEGCDAYHEQADLEGNTRPPDRAIEDVVLTGRGPEDLPLSRRFGRRRISLVRHQVRIVGVFGRSDLRGEKSHSHKKKQERKPNNGRRVPENPLERKPELT
jgi:hypothetical protein